MTLSCASASGAWALFPVAQYTPVPLSHPYVMKGEGTEGGQTTFSLTEESRGTLYDLTLTAPQREKAV